MKHFSFVVILSISSLYYGFSQSSQKIIDSLKVELRKSPKDPLKAKIYGDLTWYYGSISTDSALFYGKKALVLAKKLNDSTFLAQTITAIGILFGVIFCALARANFPKINT